MHMLLAIMALRLVDPTVAGGPPHAPPPTQETPVVSNTRIRDALTRELRAMRALSTVSLGFEGPDREIVTAAPQPIAIGGGRMSKVPVTIAASPSGPLLAPTELSLAFFVSAEPDGTIGVTGRPARDDLVAGVRLALASESRAFAAAVAALGKAKRTPPNGRTWAQAMTLARLDVRLPASQFVGKPTWHFFFGPSAEAGHLLDVLLDASDYSILLVDGQKPVP